MYNVYIYTKCTNFIKHDYILQIVILRRVVVIAFMAVFFADDHVRFDWRKRLQSWYIWRYRSNIGTLAE